MTSEYITESQTRQGQRLKRRRLNFSKEILLELAFKVAKKKYMLF